MDLYSARVQEMRRVELLGTPGVGKTTLVKELVESGEFCRLPPAVEDNYEPFWVEAQKFKGVLDCIENKRFKRYRSLIEKRLARLHHARQYPHGTILEDEGMLQRGINLAHLRPDPNLLFDYYLTVPIPDAVIVLTAKPNTILSRNVLRGEISPAKNLGEQRYFVSWVVDVAMEILRARGVPCLIIDNDNKLLEGAAAIRRALGDPRFQRVS